MTAADLRDLSDTRLREQIATARRDLFGLRMQAATGELDNTARLRGARRDLARALTIARQRGVDPNMETETEADDG
jgi:large subunit ribosomal protein L29